MIKSVLNCLVLFFFLTASCTTISCSVGSSADTISPNLPRRSFLKIEKELKVKICAPEKECVENKLRWSGSGFIVGNDINGAYIVTAAHVCDEKSAINMIYSQGGKILNKSFSVVDLDGFKYKAVEISSNQKIDMCMVYVPGLYKQAVIISSNPPKPGDIVYNLAAPVGVFAENMIPTLSGFYSGDIYGMSSYSVPAAGGSSGSPVFNWRGHLVGMIHSVHTRFQFIALSPKYDQLVEFIQRYIKQKPE